MYYLSYIPVQNVRKNHKFHILMKSYDDFLLLNIFFECIVEGIQIYIKKVIIYRAYTLICLL